MTPSVSEPKRRVDRCDSLDVVDLVIDGDDNDKNFTPPSPTLIRLLEAQRKKLRRWEALNDLSVEQTPAGDSADERAA